MKAVCLCHSIENSLKQGERSGSVTFVVFQLVVSWGNWFGLCVDFNSNFSLVTSCFCLNNSLLCEYVLLSDLSFLIHHVCFVLPVITQPWASTHCSTGEKIILQLPKCRVLLKTVVFIVFFFFFCGSNNELCQRSYYVQKSFHNQE